MLFQPPSPVLLDMLSTFSCIYEPSVASWAPVNFQKGDALFYLQRRGSCRWGHEGKEEDVVQEGMEGGERQAVDLSPNSQPFPQVNPVTSLPPWLGSPCPSPFPKARSWCLRLSCVTWGCLPLSLYPRSTGQKGQHAQVWMVAVTGVGPLVRTMHRRR